MKLGKLILAPANQIRIYSGVMPKSCESRLRKNPLLAEFKAGKWIPPAQNGRIIVASANGVASFFRVYSPNGKTCLMQGLIDHC